MNNATQRNEERLESEILGERNVKKYISLSFSHLTGYKRVIDIKKEEEISLGLHGTNVFSFSKNYMVNLYIEHLATKITKEITRLKMGTLAFTSSKWVCGGFSPFKILYVHLLQM
jgi:cell division protein FtsL